MVTPEKLQDKINAVSPYTLNGNNVDNDDTCFAGPAIEKQVSLKTGAA